MICECTTITYCVRNFGVLSLQALHGTLEDSKRNLIKISNDLVPLSETSQDEAEDVRTLHIW